MLRACKNDGGGRAASHRFPSDRVATCRGCTVMPRTARVGASPPTAARSQELEAGARLRMGVGGGVHGAMELGAQGARCGFSPELEGLQCLSLRTSLSLVQGRAWPGNARLSNRSASSFYQVRYCLVSPPPSKVLGVALPARGTVVLLHGVSMTCDVWAPYLRALADAGWAVLTYDMWGHGDSAVPRDVELTPGLLAAQLADLLDELCLTGPVHVVGFSLGCYIGALFAANCSARAASVSFLAPAAGFNSAAVNDNDFTGRNAVLNLLAKGLRVYKGFPLVARLVSPWGGFVLRCMARAAGPTRQQLAGLCYAQTRAMSVSWCSSPLSAAVQQVWGYVNALRFLAASWLWQHARSPREGVLKSIVCHGELLSSDTTPMLRRLAAARLPTLLVFGSDDPLVPKSVVRRCESLFHHAHVCEVKAGHNLVLHALPQVRQALLTFLDQM